MVQLADGFYDPKKELKAKMSEALRELILSEENKSTLGEYKIDFTAEPFKKNLETFLGTLYSLRFYLNQVQNKEELEKIDKVIDQTKHFILFQCLNKENEGKDKPIQDNYKNFYRKLSLRDSNLPKPNIFTTNYDLYSEKAMDELGITYTNGFSGFIERYFNPSIFNYALAEQMDISSFKWNVIDSYIYLFKIHGSVNWIEVEDSNKLFRIKELQDSAYEFLSKEKNLMIYPSPIKQNASLGTPYSDLFREFQKRIAQKQSVLVTMGYSFGDEHINNLIYQALTIPTFRLIIFSDLGFYRDDKYELTRINIDKLKNLNDPRIWIIGSDTEYISKPKVNSEANTEKTTMGENVDEEANDETDSEKVFFEEKNHEQALYYFSTISNDLLPDWSENIIENQNEKIIQIINSSINNLESNPK
ncbi:MAG: hypothetical protein EOP45_04275 [Sphingobacteriaceae bacterium]|nr:MAG: hypothetical protein EOP45_04275 [Sphingobacteriaceae bacterium]